jgi:LPXTG-motif cell wall-anchored protein
MNTARASSTHFEHASTTFTPAKWSNGAQGGAERLVGAQGAAASGGVVLTAAGDVSECRLAATGAGVRVGWFVAAGLFILLGGALLLATRRGAK